MPAGSVLPPQRSADASHVLAPPGLEATGPARRADWEGARRGSPPARIPANRRMTRCCPGVRQAGAPTRRPAGLAIARSVAAFGSGTPCGGARQPYPMGIPMSHLRSEVWRAALRRAPLGCALLALPAYAQQPAPLAPVVVSATGFAQALADALPSVSVIDRAQIVASGAQYVDTLLQQVAGVQIAGNGGDGQSASVFVRGFGGTDVLVLLDGVPLNAQDSTGVAYLHNLTTSQIERIEVIRGDVSALYGSGAIGGVVLITTRTHGPAASLSVRAGSRGTYGVSADASRRIGALTVHGGYSRDTTEGISAANPAQYPEANPNANGVRHTGANLALAWQLPGDGEVGMRAWRSEGRASYDSISYASPGDTNLSETTQELVQLYAHRRIEPGWTSRVDVSQQTTSNTIANFSAYPYTSNFRTQVQQLRWHNVIDLRAGWKATAGAELQHQRIESLTGDINPVGRDAQALFAGVEGRIGAEQLQLNARDDRIQGYGDHATGYFGWGHELGRGYKLIADWSSAFTAAPLGYLYAPYYGNAQLRPESAHSVEGGLQWSGAGWLLRATAFQTRLRDQWQYDFASSRFDNIAASRSRGVELRAQGSWRGWRLQGNATLQQPVDLAAAGQPTLQRRARRLANVDVERAFGAWHAGAALHASGPRWDKDGNGDAVGLGGYTTLDVHVGAPLGAGWDWNLRVQNAFDKRYQTVWGYNRQPFGVFLTLHWQLPAA
ncbi:vitamin B12 transporter BtuB precursor [mine drainage metagenome]|uniref:Vitamin B12 transporter BtuB n=1 Tax=mine drainage metagenome TaxID=410659 RepID=A0A1J5R047_9ZZZZ